MNEVVVCKHRAGYAEWIRNDGQGAPVLLVELFIFGPTLLTLTNPTIYVKCPCCFEANRPDVAARYCP